VLRAKRARQLIARRTAVEINRACLGIARPLISTSLYGDRATKPQGDLTGAHSCFTCNFQVIKGSASFVACHIFRLGSRTLPDQSQRSTMGEPSAAVFLDYPYVRRPGVRAGGTRVRKLGASASTQ